MEIKKIVDKIKRRHTGFTKKLDKKQKKLFYILEFFILINILLTPLYLISYTNYEFFSFNVMTAEIASHVLNSFGVESYLTKEYGGISIGVEGLPQMFVSNACSGVIPIFLLFGLIFALPESKIKTKLKYFLIFLPITYFINILRIVITAGVGLNAGIEKFDLVHMSLWSYLMIFVVFGMWVYFIHKEKLKLTY